MRRGFTLIELLVTMAIISILAGVMVPSVWKWWEAQEIQTTRERLNALKLAMVGDRNLYQNGVRTSYGYVGDHGDIIPVQQQLSSLKHYMPAGFDSDSFLKDAWGNDITYTIAPDANTAARFSSPGVNGAPIILDILEKEVRPTFSISGEIYKNYTAVRSVKIFSTPPSILEYNSNFINLPGAGIYAIPYSPPSITLPIGTYQVYWCYDSEGINCQDVGKRKYIYIHDGMSALNFKLTLE